MSPSPGALHMAAFNSNRANSRSELDETMDRLNKTPRNAELWKTAVDLAEQDGRTEKIQRVYSSLLEFYPDTPAAQIAHINHYLQDPTMFNKAEDLFREYLRSSPSVELCRFYLNYVRRVNTQPGSRESVRMSFDFALSHIGQDKDSGDIWADYIQFLSDSSPSTTWEAQQRMDSLRKVYHRAVQVPLENLQRLWEGLETFETGLNKITGKKFLNQLSPAYMQARQALRELKAHYDSLGLSSLATLPAATSQPTLHLPAAPTFGAADRALLCKWKRYLKWEQDNPLQFEDQNLLVQRVMGAFRKALSRMRFWPEIWFMAFSYLTSVSKHDDAFSMIQSGVRANPSSFLLNFALCELLEKKAMADTGVPKDFSHVYAAYEHFLDILRQDLKDAASREEWSASSQEMRSPESTQHPSQQSLRRGFSLVYVMLLRFAQRAEGLKGSRAVFSRARKEGAVLAGKEGEDRKITRRTGAVGWEVYEAAALMEYHLSEDKSIPAKIFEIGMEFFGDDVAYVERHLGYLIAVRDEKNARALFERSIKSSALPPEKARPLWERWAKYEYQYGTLEGGLSLEKRMREAYPKETPTKRFAQRYSYLDIDSIASEDLGAGFLHPGLSSFNSTSSIRSSSPSLTLPQKRPSSPEVSSGGNGKRPRQSSPPASRLRGGVDRDDRGRPAVRAKENGGWSKGRRSPQSTRSPSSEQCRNERTTKVAIPAVLSEFIGRLPCSAAFEGPFSNPEDLMKLFRNAVIPSSTSRPRSPHPVRSGVNFLGGQPPQDYGSPSPRY